MQLYSYKKLGELVTRMQSGDDSAFEKIYEATYQVQYFQILQLIPESGQADDILQQVYLNLWQNRMNIKKQEALIAYLNKITWNECRKYRISQKHERNMFSEEHLLDTVEMKSKTPEQEAEFRDMSSRMIKALQLLDEEAKAAVLFRYVRKMKIQKIAEILGLSPSTVKRLIRSALSQMRYQMHIFLPGLGITMLAARSARCIPPLPKKCSEGMESREAAKRVTDPTKYCCASVGAVLAGLIFILITSAVKIDKVSLLNTNSEQGQVIEIKVSSVVPLEKVTIQYNTSKAVTLTPDGKSYKALVGQNGVYTIRAVSRIGKADVEKINVTRITD